MRRVYYSYAVSILTHAMFWQGVFLSVAAVLLAKWLHVASIMQNFLATPVGNIPQYMLGSVSDAISQGELLTVLTFFSAAGVAVSAGYQLAQSLLSRHQFIVRI